MEDFQIIHLDNVVVVKVDLVAATHRDANPLWATFENNSLFEHAKIIIDISCCMHVDSTFIGMIVKIFRKVCVNKGQLKLIFPQLTSVDSFRVTGISKVLECFDSVEEALIPLKLKLPVRDILLNQEIAAN